MVLNIPYLTIISILRYITSVFRIYQLEEIVYAQAGFFLANRLGNAPLSCKPIRVSVPRPLG